MVKFAQIQKDSVVQLGRFYKDMSKYSGKTGIVVAKQTLKIGKNVYTSIAVKVGPKDTIEVALHNIKENLA